MARPRKNIDKDQFEKLCSIFCTEEEIAHFFSCDTDTISRFVKREYNDTLRNVKARYRSQGKITLRRLQFQSAQRGHWPAQETLGKIYLDQNIKQGIELSGPNEGDISLKHSLDLNQLDTTELEQLDSILSKQKKKIKNASDV